MYSLLIAAITISPVIMLFSFGFRFVFAAMPFVFGKYLGARELLIATGIMLLVLMHWDRPLVLFKGLGTQMQ
jgi:hypothetical protein